MPLTKEQAIEYVVRQAAEDGVDISSGLGAINYVIGLLQQHLPQNIQNNIKTQLANKITAENNAVKTKLKNQLINLGVDPTTQVGDIT